ncbi:MAG TPA: quinol:electron acceptor oxidoreductase subunit ActD [Acidobacteriota bacterium]|nr:quinol:electron acceptor oxidoreductase subunit ActD [Acidobacteriota bacterium]
MNPRRVFSVLGLFDSAPLLMQAIPKVKTNVTARLEAYSPFPIHGIDEALGLRKSPLTGMVLVMGIIGVISGLGFELWTSGIDYPLMTAGKPYFSWEAFIPIMFEIMVLFACFTAGLGMLMALNRLPFFRHPMLRSKAMGQITRDKFALAVEPKGETLDVDAIASVLKEAGAVSVEVIEAPEPIRIASPDFLLSVLLAIVISSAVSGYATYWAIKLFPVSIPMVHMLDQPRLDPQRPSGFFKDGFGMRMPVPGTVARGTTLYGIGSEDEAGTLVNPMPRTGQALRQGQQDYRTYCSVCHGIRGDGVPTLTAAYGAKPANLVSRTIIDLPDGKIHHVIIDGKNAMPAYAADLPEDERWAVVHYVRALQRASNAKDDDIK